MFVLFVFATFHTSYVHSVGTCAPFANIPILNGLCETQATIVSAIFKVYFYLSNVERTKGRKLIHG